MSPDEIIGVLSSMGETLVHVPIGDFIDALPVAANVVQEPRQALLRRLAQAAKLMQETYAEIIQEAEKAKVVH